MLRRQLVRIQYQNVKVFDEHINDLITSLSSSKEVVDLQPAFFKFTLATTSALIFGEPPDGLSADQKGLDQTTFKSSFDYASMDLGYSLTSCWLPLGIQTKEIHGGM